ncbi:MAG: hypothetical protein JSS51_04025 [Planctomycetes bacterium]|nr:hypothetical protein [Planctomycetota bacterium]
MRIKLTNRDNPKESTFVETSAITSLVKVDSGTYISLSGGNAVYVTETPSEIHDAIEAAESGKKPAKAK